MTKKERDAAFLNGPDISVCQHCGECQHIWHIFGRGDNHDHVTGMICTRCFWTCGDATIIDAVSCWIEEIKLIAARRRRIRQGKRRTHK